MQVFSQVLGLFLTAVLVQSFTARINLGSEDGLKLPATYFRGEHSEIIPFGNLIQDRLLVIEENLFSELHFTNKSLRSSNPRLHAPTQPPHVFALKGTYPSRLNSSYGVLEFETLCPRDQEKENVRCWLAMATDDIGPNEPVIATGIDLRDEKTYAKVNCILQDPEDDAMPVSASSDDQKGFQFVDVAGEHLDLKFDGRNVIRFVYKRYDGSSPDAQYMTFKPFHHVFDPGQGKLFLTADAHPNTKEYLYPHHRGLFFGFNRISYQGKTADTWHGKDGVHTSCLSLEPLILERDRASHCAVIGWFGSDGQKFATERRTVTASCPSGGTLIDWTTEVSTQLPLIRLEGDPQHAGFHFRANQEVAMKNAKQTYFVRPDGRGALGETRNWDAKAQDARTVNLPWNAMSFVVQGNRYTVLRVSHPDNPSPARGSERDYGRFGDYFEYDLTPNNPLRLRYRLWIQEGEMTPDQCARWAWNN